MIPKHDITGLILAGGRASRMCGLDKGLQAYRGQPLAGHALARLAPQVGQVFFSANRNPDAYRLLGAPVWADTLPGYQGPLAGFLAGLENCRTPYLVTVPCDCPRFPDDLVARLAQALVEHDAEVSVAASHERGERNEPGALRAHPVFCLLRTDLRESLRRFMAGGQRRVSAWSAQHRCVTVPFDEATAFAGANTLDELQCL